MLESTILISIFYPCTFFVKKCKKEAELPGLTFLGEVYQPINFYKKLIKNVEGGTKKCK